MDSTVHPIVIGPVIYRLNLLLSEQLIDELKKERRYLGCWLRRYTLRFRPHIEHMDRSKFGRAVLSFKYTPRTPGTGASWLIGCKTGVFHMYYSASGRHTPVVTISI